jgi:hypothetical protein
MMPPTSARAGLLAAAAAPPVRVEIAAVLAFVRGAVGMVVGPMVVASATDEVLVVAGADGGAGTGEEYDQVAHVGEEAAGAGDGQGPQVAGLDAATEDTGAADDQTPQVLDARDT